MTAESVNKEPKKEGIVIIAEDDQTFRRLLARSIEMHGYSTREAQNGLVAKTIFDLNPSEVRLIITDIKMPEVDGVELLTYIRSKTKTPVIMMTGFSELLEMQEAHDLGADEFLAKPFSTQSLFEAIQRCLDPKPEPSSEELASSPPAKEVYCAIHIDEFISSTRLLSDIYVKLSAAKYVKVAHKDEAIPVERLAVYKERRVEYLYVALGDFQSYVDFNFKVATLAKKSAAVSTETKLKLFKNTAEIMMKNCFFNDLDPGTVMPAKMMVENTLGIISEDPDILNLLLSLKSQSDQLYAHCVAVSVYASMIARAHGWTSPNTQFRIVTAGLFHDIGKKEIPAEIILKSRAMRSAEETKLLESHPIRGRDLILQLGSMPDDVAQIVSQHHENPSGTGYPQRPKARIIHPLARLIGTVDYFVDLVMPAVESVPALSPKQALQRIFQVGVDNVDVTHLRRLMDIFKVTEDQLQKN
jgi:putative nucleotidyltransferase with HDIG domain